MHKKDILLYSMIASIVILVITSIIILGLMPRQPGEISDYPFSEFSLEAEVTISYTYDSSLGLEYTNGSVLYHLIDMSKDEISNIVNKPRDQIFINELEVNRLGLVFNMSENDYNEFFSKRQVFGIGSDEILFLEIFVSENNITTLYNRNITVIDQYNQNIDLSFLIVNKEIGDIHLRIKFYFNQLLIFDFKLWEQL